MGRDMKKVYKSNTRWKKKALKRIPLEVRKEYFSAVLDPIIEESGESVNGWIKKAIDMRLGLSEDEIQRRIEQWKETQDEDLEEETT